MYLDNYHCDWERVQLVLKSDDNTMCDNMIFWRPREMWDNVLGQWTMYCPKDANSAFNGCLGDDIQIEGYNEDNKIARVTFTRADGYQIAIIKFEMEDK